MDNEIIIYSKSFNSITVLTNDIQINNSIVTIDNNRLKITPLNAKGGVTFNFPTTPNIEYTITFDVDLFNTTVSEEFSVTAYDDDIGVYSFITDFTPSITVNNTYSFKYTGNNNGRLIFYFRNPPTSNHSFYLDNIIISCDGTALSKTKKIDPNLSFMELYEKIISFDVRNHLSKVELFVSSNTNKIINYYTNNVNEIDPNIFFELDNLIFDTKRILELTSLNKYLLTNIAFCDIIETIETIDNSLIHLYNSPKWCRSSISGGIYSNKFELTTILKQGDTFEKISQNIVGSNNPDDDWVDIALKNDLKEEDYTPLTINKIKVDLTINNAQSIKINSIVDVINNDNILGIDLDKKLTFINDDLKVLSPIDTFKQTVTILGGLKQGDNPEFPNRGISNKLLVGSNVGSLIYPTLFRQLAINFSDDDTIKNFIVLDAKKEGDSLVLNYQIENRLNELNSFLTKI